MVKIDLFSRFVGEFFSERGLDCFVFESGTEIPKNRHEFEVVASAGRDAWEDEDGEWKWGGDTGSEDELEGEARLRVSLGFLWGEYSEQPDWEESGWFDPVHSSYM